MSPQQLLKIAVDTLDTLLYYDLGIVLVADIHLETADIHFEAVDIHFEAADIRFEAAGIHFEAAGNYPLVGSHLGTVDMTAVEIVVVVAADNLVVDMPDNHLEVVDNPEFFDMIEVAVVLNWKGNQLLHHFDFVVHSLNTVNMQHKGLDYHRTMPYFQLKLEFLQKRCFNS